MAILHIFLSILYHNFAPFLLKARYTMTLFTYHEQHDSDIGGSHAEQETEQGVYTNVYNTHEQDECYQDQQGLPFYSVKGVVLHCF